MFAFLQRTNDSIIFYESTSINFRLLIYRKSILLVKSKRISHRIFNQRQMALTFASLRRTNGLITFQKPHRLISFDYLSKIDYFPQEQAGLEWNFQKSHFATLLAKIRSTRCRRSKKRWIVSVERITRHSKRCGFGVKERRLPASDGTRRPDREFIYNDAEVGKVARERLVCPILRSGQAKRKFLGKLTRSFPLLLLFPFPFSYPPLACLSFRRANGTPRFEGVLEAPRGHQSALNPLNFQEPSSLNP